MAIIKSKDVLEVEQITKDLKKVRDEVDLLTKSNDKLSTSLQKVKKSNDGTEAKKLATQTDRLNKSTLKLKDTLTAEDAVKKQLLRANAKLSESRTKAAKDLALVRQKTLQANKALRDQAKASLGVKKSFFSLGKQLLGAAGLVGGFQIFISVLKDAFKIIVEFQKTNSKLAAILGKTKDEIKGLSDQQKELGSTTAFTASQVGELQIELAKLGFTLREIEASTPGILALAAATGTDLASSAELAGATLRIFNLDASEMSRVTDVLALSTSKSSLDMAKLATILPTVGKTAQIAGVSLEKTAALAGTLTDRGLEASTAATSLRNIFLELSKKGLTWNEAMTQINESTDKNKTSMDLFGKRAASAGVILSETATSTEELTSALEDADGAAQNMADTMLNNLAGDITIAASAWEGFILSLEDGEGVLSRMLRGSVQRFTDFLGTLTTFNETNFVNKLKIMANSVLVLFNKFVPIVDIFNTLTGSSFKLEFEIENTSKSIDKQTDALGFLNTALGQQADFIKKVTEEEIKATTETKKLTKAQIAQNEALKAQNIIRERQKDLVSTIDGIPVSVILSNKQKLEDEKALIEDNARARKQAKADEDFEKAKERAGEEGEELELIKEQAFTSGQQLASDIFSSFQDERLAESRANADAEIAILQDRLDKGVISEEQFTKEVAAIEKNERIKSAKAEKKKALFDVAIATAVGIIKALAALRPGLAVAIGVAGGIQAAAIAAKPIPKLAKGEVNIGGKSHAQGGNLVEVEKGETYVNKEATAQSTGILNMVNDGLISDKNLPQLNNQDNNMMLAGLLMSGNGYAKDLVTLMGNMCWTYDRNGERVINKADGSLIEKFNV